MKHFRVSSETRNLGRLTYTLAAIVVGTARFGVTLEPDKVLPIGVSDRFPALGVVGIIVIFTELSMIARLTEEASDFYYNRSFLKHWARDKPLTTLADVSIFKPDLVNWRTAQVISKAPHVGMIASYITLLLEAVIPLFFGFVAIIYSIKAVFAIFSHGFN